VLGQVWNAISSTTYPERQVIAVAPSHTSLAVLAQAARGFDWSAQNG
jgi:hypothetical protein